MKLYIGCDPGQEGGFVVLTQTGKVVEVFKTPENRTLFREKLDEYTGSHCFCLLEKISPRPPIFKDGKNLGNGGKANFTLGANVERLLYTLELQRIPYEEIPPQRWMKHYMLQREKGMSQNTWKNVLKKKAQQLFPESTITLWNADAFLIAEYARRHY